MIAATNRDLRQLVDDGRFQDDLFYRLHVFPIALPPLRERGEDIPLLVEHFVRSTRRGSASRSTALEDGVCSTLQHYDWPGNVRELENTIERAVVLATGPTITRDVVTADPEARVRTGDRSLAEAAPERGMDRVRNHSSRARHLDRQAAGGAAHGHQPAGTVLLPRKVSVHRPARCTVAPGHATWLRANRPDNWRGRVHAPPCNWAQSVIQSSTANTTIVTLTTTSSQRCPLSTATLTPTTPPARLPRASAIAAGQLT